MPASNTEQLRLIGSQLGEYVRGQSGNPPSPGALQGVIADLTASLPDLQAPLRDLVGRQAFTALLPYALSPGGSIQRDALIQEISRVYNAKVLVEVEEVLNGFLDASGGIAISLSQTSSTYDLPKSNEQTANEPNTWIKADISSSTPKVSASTNTIPVTDRENLKPFEKLFLLGAGAVAVVAGIAGLATMSSGKSCSQLSDELKPLRPDSSEFKRLINENKQKCGNQPGFLIEQAYLARYEGDDSRALQLIDRSLSIKPNNDYAYSARGGIYYGLGDYKNMLTALDRALEISPRNSEYSLSKATSLSMLNRPKEAIAWYDKTIELSPSNSAAFRERGREKLGLKQYADSLKDLDKAIQLNSTDGESFIQRAYTKTWLDDFPSACADIKKAKALGIKETFNWTKKVSIDTMIKEICN